MAGHVLRDSKGHFRGSTKGFGAGRGAGGAGGSGGGGRKVAARTVGQARKQLARRLVFSGSLAAQRKPAEARGYASSAVKAYRRDVTRLRGKA